MTPLAARLAKQLTLPVREREEVWRDNATNLRSALDDVHCFECTGALPMLDLMIEMFENQSAHEHIHRMLFLPAPKTWLEWKFDWAPERIALLLEQKTEQSATVTLFSPISACDLGKVSTVSDDYERPEGLRYLPNWLTKRYTSKTMFDALLSLAHFFLIVINSPKVIGRRQHMPHAGLERRMLRARRSVGKFPLHAWTEILLKVRPPHVDENDHEAHLTGKRALHFCRAHLRLKQGRLEHVSSHWRGDAAIGIKRSRYRVEA